MKDKNKDAFRKFLLSIERGNSFSSALRDACHEKISALWREFTKEVKASAGHMAAKLEN